MVNQLLLEEIGLTKSEIKVYLALLELGSSTTGPIVDKSKVASSKIYEILDKLIQKGLASFIIRSGTKHFEAASPKRILDYVSEKKNQLNRQEQQINDLIPELELKQKLSGLKSEATVFKGIKGAETAFSDILKTLKKGDEYYVIGATDPNPVLLRFILHYHQRRSKQGIKVKLLFAEQGKKWADQIKSIPLTEIKFAPGQLFTTSFVLMYQQKTLIVVSSKNDITLFRIDNKEVTESFKSQFELLWNQNIKVFHGLDAIQDLWDDMLNYDECKLIGARGYFVDKRPEFIDYWEKRAIKKGFKWYNIVDPEVKGHRVTKFTFAETRYNIPKEFATLSVYWIYGNKVVVSNWMGDEPVVFIIENKNINKVYLKQFELLWNKKIR